MKKRFHQGFENDATPSRIVAQRYRASVYGEGDVANLGLIHYRGGEEEFLLGCEYCASSDARDRACGADILAQLGWGDCTFREESITILIPLLQDSDSSVIYSAAVALGHRKAKSAIPALLQIAEHPDPEVRYGVVLGLTGQDDERSIDALIKLSADENYDVRNWAVFGLGAQIESDSPTIREALRRALKDSDHEIRGEALVGLAKRKDSDVVSELLKEWKDDSVSTLSLEAAAEIRDPRLLPRLRDFVRIFAPDDEYFSNTLHDAITACTSADK